MKILKDDHCPNCGVPLERVRQGISGTPCGLFHVHPGLARMVIEVVNDKRDDIRTVLFNDGEYRTRHVVPAGEVMFSSVEEAVTEVLDNMHEVIFPDD